MARLWAMTTTFGSVNVGDQLPILVKWETQETIATPALVAYMAELLEKAFPIPSATAGDGLEVRAILPVLLEDTISLTGWVVDKQTAGDQRLVRCEIQVENQRGETVAQAAATVSL